MEYVVALLAVAGILYLIYYKIQKSDKKSGGRGPAPDRPTDVEQN